MPAATITIPLDAYDAAMAAMAEVEAVIGPAEGWGSGTEYGEALLALRAARLGLDLETISEWEIDGTGCRLAVAAAGDEGPAR